MFTYFVSISKPFYATCGCVEKLTITNPYKVQYFEYGFAWQATSLLSDPSLSLCTYRVWIAWGLFSLAQLRKFYWWRICAVSEPLPKALLSGSRSLPLVWDWCLNRMKPHTGFTMGWWISDSLSRDIWVVLPLSLGATFGVDQSRPGHVGYQIWYNVFFSLGG